MQVCDLNICSKPAAEKYQVNMTSWNIKETKSHIHRSHYAHCGDNYGATSMCKHQSGSSIYERTEWMIRSFWNFIWCFLLTLGRGKNSSGMKLHIEKDLMGMYIFNEKADVKKSWKHDSRTQQPLYKSQAGCLHFRTEAERHSMIFCGSWQGFITTGKLEVYKSTRGAIFKSLFNYADGRNDSSSDI